MSRERKKEKRTTNRDFLLDDKCFLK